MEVVEHLGSAIAIGDESGQQARLTRFAEDGYRPLAGDQRLVVGAYNYFRTLRQRVFYQKLGIGLQRRRDGVRIAKRLGGDPILTVCAVQIAAKHSEAIGQGSGIGMEERLLFDGMALPSRDITVGNIEGATLVEAHLADAGLSVGDRATVAAGVAAHPISIELFPQRGVGFADTLVRGENVVHRLHGYILRLWIGQR